MLKNFEEGIKRIWLIIFWIWIILMTIIFYNVIEKGNIFSTLITYFLIAFILPIIIYSLIKFIYKGFKGE
jgi:predicted Na+-dependent transporter